MLFISNLLFYTDLAMFLVGGVLLLVHPVAGAVFIGLGLILFVVRWHYVEPKVFASVSNEKLRNIIEAENSKFK